METGKMKLSIKAAYIGACLPAVSTDSIRCYLNGVHIAPSPNGEGVICVATDGHRMIVARDPEGTIEGAELTEWGTGPILAIPKDAVKYLKDTRQSERVLNIQGGVAMVDEAGTDATLYQWQAQFIDGTFPDWRRALPNMDAAKPAWGMFNAKYLGDFAKVHKAFGLSGEGIQVFAAETTADKPYTEGAALVKFAIPHDVFGVLMPMRGGKDASHSLPGWIEPPKAFSQAAE